MADRILIFGHAPCLIRDEIVALLSGCALKSQLSSNPLWRIFIRRLRKSIDPTNTVGQRFRDQLVSPIAMVTGSMIGLLEALVREFKVIRICLL